MNLNKKLIKSGVCLTLCSLVIAAGGCRTETSQILKERPPQIYYNYTELLTEDRSTLIYMNLIQDVVLENNEVLRYFISPETFRYVGTFYWNDFRWTYYSERVLPGGGLNIPGRWSDVYFVRDGDGCICLASSDFPWGTYLPTPWGQGRVYDSGCASGTLDVYVTW